MDATAHLVVGRDVRGRSVATTMRGEAPLLLRATAPDRSDCADRADGGALQVHMVGGAAGPLGGDRLHLALEVGPSAELVVRSVAASLALPGRDAAAGSLATVSATVAAGASLDWQPEPLISVRGSRHTQSTDVVVADDTATVRWVDEVMLGRHGEASGKLVVRQRLTVGGRPLLHHTVGFDPETDGIGRHGRTRAVVTGFLLGPPALPPASAVTSSHRIARFPLSDTCTAWVALAATLDAARHALAGLDL